jgi:hypothetical protein
MHIKRIMIEWMVKSLQCLLMVGNSEAGAGQHPVVQMQKEVGPHSAEEELCGVRDAAYNDNMTYLVRFPEAPI